MADPGPYAAPNDTCEYCFLHSLEECYHRTLPNGRHTDIICGDCWEVFKRVNLWPIKRLNRIVRAARSPHATQPETAPMKNRPFHAPPTEGDFERAAENTRHQVEKWTVTDPDPDDLCVHDPECTCYCWVTLANGVECPHNTKEKDMPEKKPTISKQPRVPGRSCYYCDRNHNFVYEIVSTNSLVRTHFCKKCLTQIGNARYL